VAEGEAQWTNGYRAGSGKGDDAALWEKEKSQWRYVHAVQTELKRFISAYGTARAREAT
jgi:hypothetical protein